MPAIVLDALSLHKDANEAKKLRMVRSYSKLLSSSRNLFTRQENQLFCGSARLLRRFYAHPEGAQLPERSDDAKTGLGNLHHFEAPGS